MAGQPAPTMMTPVDPSRTSVTDEVLNLSGQEVWPGASRRSDVWACAHVRMCAGRAERTH